MQYIKVSEKNDIYALLVEFLEVFPNLREKISSLDEYAQKLSEFAYVYAVTENSQQVGVLVFYANDRETKTAYISLIGVKKGNERKGIGKDMLNYCQQLSRENGMCKIRLEVDEGNENAIIFYEKNGFSFVDKTKHNSFYMMKDL